MNYILKVLQIVKSTIKKVPRIRFIPSKVQLTWRNILLIVSSIVFIYSVSHMAIIQWERYQNKVTYAAAQDLYFTQEQIDNQEIEDHLNLKSTEQNEETAEASDINEPNLIVQEKFDSLLEQNIDIVGWIQIADTNVNYPVVQAADNDYYLRRDYLGNPHGPGSIFMDFRNQIDQRNRNIILYGHYMRDLSMFGELLKYKDKAFYDEHKLIAFDTLYDNDEWEIFSVYKTTTDFYYIETEFENDEQFADFIEQLQAKSMHEINVEVTADDTILTLSTCEDYNSDVRFVVHAKLMPNEDNHELR